MTTCLRVATAFVVSTVLLPPTWSSAAPAYRPVSGATFRPSEVRISANGRYVVFTALATSYNALVTFQTGATAPPTQVYLTDLKTGTPELVSVSTRGTPGNKPSGEPAVSGDGRYVAFASQADNLVAGDTNDVQDVFLRDRVAKRTVRLSLDVRGRQLGYVSRSTAGWYDLGGTSAQAIAGYPSISKDASTIAFFSTGNVAAAKTFVHSMGGPSLYAYSRLKGPAATRTVGRFADGVLMSPQVNLSYPMQPAAVSADGRYVAASTGAPWQAGGTPTPAEPWNHVFVRDLKTGALRILTAAPPPEATGTTWGPGVPTNHVAVDDTGTKVVFEQETVLALDRQYLNRQRVLLWNTRSGTVTQVDGAATTVAGASVSDGVVAWVGDSSISGDGRRLVYTVDTCRNATAAVLPASACTRPELVSDDFYARLLGFDSLGRTVLERDLSTGVTTAVAPCDPAVPATAAQSCTQSTYAPAVSADGRVVAFVSTGSLSSADHDAPASTDPNRATSPDDVYVRTT